MKTTISARTEFLPRYAVAEVIGEGAAANIYRVIDRRDGSLKAIKALKAGSQEESSVVVRFEDEYRILHGLHHPSLPEVHDYGFSAAGRRYMVMECVEGDRLDRYVGAHKDDLWLLLYELCEVLSFIHARDLLHQDLKPANILVRRTAAFGPEKPLLTLLDFGLSYRRGEGEKVNLVGTPMYMAPEIIRGEPALTRAVDYYSLGITLYELIEGRTPFQGDVREVFAAHLNDEVRFSRERTEYAELYPHVRGMLSKDARSRLEAFEEFRRAVSARMSGEIDELERAYGLSFISSIGKIGNKEASEKVGAWLEGVGAFVAACQRVSRPVVGGVAAGVSVGGAAPARGTESTRGRGPTAKQSGTGEESSSFVRDLKAELLAAVPEVPEVEVPTVALDTPRPPRAVVISGAAGSGKSYLIDELRAQAVLAGRSVWILGQRSEYESLVGDGDAAGTGHEPTGGSTGRKPRRRPKTVVAPEADTIERFMKGWERLADAAKDRGVVLIADGFEQLGEEEREFLEYVKKRSELAAAEEGEVSIYLAISGTHPRLHQKLRDVVPSGQATTAVVLTYPQTSDIEEVVDMYRGRTVSLEDRKYLYQYLRTCDSSASDVVAGLRDALMKGTLTYSRGRWRFGLEVMGEPGAKRTDAEYYRALLEGLDGNERELLSWLSCHRGSVPVDRLSRASGMVADHIKTAVEALDPLRILEVNRVDDVLKVGLPSESVREALYGAVDASFCRRAHEAFVEVYTTELSSPASRRRLASARQVDLYNLLSFHYERLRDFERMFRTHLRIMAVLRAQGRVYDTRDLCARGAAITRKLRGKKWARRRWHLERFYLKRWIEAEWSVNNYKGIVEVVRSQLTRRRRALPVSFAYRYCLSLVNLDRPDEAMRIVKYVRSRFGRRRSAPYVVSLIIEAIVLYHKGDPHRAKTILEAAEKHSDVINAYTRARMFVGMMTIADSLGDMSLYERALNKMEVVASESNLVNEKVVSLHGRINYLFSQSRYEEAKASAQQAIALSLKHRLYHRQQFSYFLSSALYYEEGAFDRALNHIEKSLQLAQNLGMTSKVTDTLTRIGMNYQNMGRYGDAIRVIEKAYKTAGSAMDASQRATCLLFLFDMHLCLRSARVKKIKTQVDAKMKHISTTYRRAYYHHLLGVYYEQVGDYKRAVEELRQARSLNEKVDVLDDAIRAAIKEAVLWVSEGRFDRARRLIAHIESRMANIPSKNIVAEFSALKLAYHYKIKDRVDVLVRQLHICLEKADMAYEMPTLLAIDKLLFRVNARLGRTTEASRHFGNYYDRVKRIVSNLTDRRYAESFLNDHDTKLALREYKLIAE